MQLQLESLAAVALVLATSVGCAHRTTTTHTSEMVRTDSAVPQVAAPPAVDETTTVIKRSQTHSEGSQP